MSGAINSPDAERLGPLASLRRRVYLTYRYLGWRTLLFRIVTFPLRFTPLRRRLQLRSRAGQDAYRRGSGACCRSTAAQASWRSSSKRVPTRPGAAR